ncbi:MAG: fimA 2 [Proteobacteria bacterium]|nr:fimA 2 [Pseudomonadota bacterium]
MKYSQTPTVILCVLFVYSTYAFAKNPGAVVAPGGNVHMRGRLTTGACVVSADSQDLHVDMGKYTTHDFERRGDISTPGIPFTLHLTDCSSGVTAVGITFSGVTAPKEPDVFQVTTSDTRPVGISGDNGYSGLGLLLTDAVGNPVIPNASPEVFYHPDGTDMSLHYIARYRATSRAEYPGELHSDVRFDIAYQ